MVGFMLIVEGMSVAPKPVLGSGIDLDMESPSWSGAGCHSIIGLSLWSLQAISKLCITGKTSPPSCGTLPAVSSWHDLAWQCHQSYCSFCAWFPARQECQCSAIEHIWDLLDRRVRARAIPPRNVWELAGALMGEWGNISQQELANLVQSTRRCTAVLNAASGHTRYWLLLLILTPPLFKDTLFHFC